VIGIDRFACEIVEQRNVPRYQKLSVWIVSSRANRFQRMKQSHDYGGVARSIRADLIERLIKKLFEAGSSCDHAQLAIFENEGLRDAPVGQTHINGG
jgi:hypothetical protein